MRKVASPRCQEGVFLRSWSGRIWKDHPDWKTPEQEFECSFGFLTSLEVIVQLICPEGAVLLHPEKDQCAHTPSRCRHVLEMCWGPLLTPLWTRGLRTKSRAGVLLTTFVFCSVDFRSYYQLGSCDVIGFYFESHKWCLWRGPVRKSERLWVLKYYRTSTIMRIWDQFRVKVTDQKQQFKDPTLTRAIHQPTTPSSTGASSTHTFDLKKSGLCLSCQSDFRMRRSPHSPLL